jgi:hypothetical protein
MVESFYSAGVQERLVEQIPEFEFFPTVDAKPVIEVASSSLGRKIGEGSMVEVFENLDNGGEVVIQPLVQTTPRYLVVQAVALARLGMKVAMLLDEGGSLRGLKMDNLGDASVEDVVNGSVEGYRDKLLIAGVVAGARTVFNAHDAGVTIHDLKRDSFLFSRARLEQALDSGKTPVEIAGLISMSDFNVSALMPVVRGEKIVELLGEVNSLDNLRHRVQLLHQLNREGVLDNWRAAFFTFGFIAKKAS